MSNVVSLRSKLQTLDLKGALDELDPDQRQVIEARWGLNGEEPLSDDEVAEKYGWDIEWVWQLYDKALQLLGYLWLTETPLPLFLEEAA